MHLGACLVDLIPKVYDTARAIHILQEDDETQEVMINVPAIDKKGRPILINDMNAGVYDIRVKIGPSYSTRKQEAASSMLDFVKIVPQAGAVAGDLIAKNMDWPGSEEIAERLKSTLPPNVRGDEPTPQDMAATQANQQFQDAMKAAQLRLAQGRAADAHAKAVKTAVQARNEATAGAAAASPGGAAEANGVPGMAAAYGHAGRARRMRSRTLCFKNA